MSWSQKLCFNHLPKRNLEEILWGSLFLQSILAHFHQECPEEFLNLKDKDAYKLFHALANGILFCKLNTSPSFCLQIWNLGINYIFLILKFLFFILDFCNFKATNVMLSEFKKKINKKKYYYFAWIKVLCYLNRFVGF